jgi:O-antigen/teichoic acid export membrane protein
MASPANETSVDRIDPSLITPAKVATTTLWGASATFVAVASRGLRLILVAPYVSAHDYGLLAATFVILEGVNACSDLGTQAALVRHPGRIAHVLDAGFTLQAIRGIAVAALLYAVGPLAGAWFQDDAVVPVVRAMAAVPLLAGLSNPAMALLRRRLEFRTLFACALVEGTVTLAAGVALAVTLGNVWALVIAAILGEFVQLIASYVVARPWPRPSWQWPQAAELIRFGRWVFGSRILMFLGTRGDDLFVATVLGTTAVGVYSVAFRYAELPVLLVTHVIAGVALPVWSGIAADPRRLRSWFVRTCLCAAGVNATIAIVALGAAPHLLPLPQGMTWEASRPLLAVLLVASFGRSLVILAEPYFYSAGRPAAWFWMNVWRVGATAILIVPLSSRLGVVGVALAVTAGVFVAVPVAILKMRAVAMKA